MKNKKFTSPQPGLGRAGPGGEGYGVLRFSRQGPVTPRSAPPHVPHSRGVELDVKGSDSVENLKSRIVAKFQATGANLVSITQFILYHKKLEMRHGRTLSDYNVQPKSDIVIWRQSEYYYGPPRKQ